jgi:hypothetical protein
VIVSWLPGASKSPDSRNPVNTKVKTSCEVPVATPLPAPQMFSGTGSSGSIARISLRIAPAMARGSPLVRAAMEIALPVETP